MVRKNWDFVSVFIFLIELKILLASGVLYDDLHVEWNDVTSIKHLFP